MLYNCKLAARQFLFVLLLTGVQHESLAADKKQEVETKKQIFELKLGANRVVYLPESKGSTLAVMNAQDYPILVKSSVLGEDKKNTAPFIITPPLFRLDAQQQTRVRIIQTGGDFAKDRETLQWLCVTGIPPQADDEWSKENGQVTKPSQAIINLQVSVSSCIKLLVRPSAVKGTPTDVATSLVWKRQGNKLKVTNPTPFYMNFQSISVEGRKVDGLEYVPPQGEREFLLPQKVTGSVVEWQLITDLGGESRSYKSTLQ